MSFVKKIYLLIFILLVFVSLLNTVYAHEKTWWDTNWNYRKQLVIKENSGNNLVYYPVDLFIDFSSWEHKPLAFNKQDTDIRIVLKINNDWFEIPSQVYNITPFNCGKSYCEIKSANIIFEIQNLKSSSETEEYYLYYNNPTAIKSNYPTDLALNENKKINVKGFNETYIYAANNFLEIGIAKTSKSLGNDEVLDSGTLQYGKKKNGTDFYISSGKSSGLTSYVSWDNQPSSENFGNWKYKNHEILSDGAVAKIIKVNAEFSSEPYKDQYLETTYWLYANQPYFDVKIKWYSKNQHILGYDERGIRFGFKEIINETLFPQTSKDGVFWACLSNGNDAIGLIPMESNFDSYVYIKGNEIRPSVSPIIKNSTYWIKYRKVFSSGCDSVKTEWEKINEKPSITFKSEESLEDWLKLFGWLRPWKYRKKITLYETHGITRKNEPVTVNVKFDPFCQLKAYSNSIRVTDGRGVEVPSEVLNIKWCAVDWIKEADVKFQANLNANSRANYFVYYSDNTSIKSKYYTWDLPDVEGNYKNYLLSDNLKKSKISTGPFSGELELRDIPIEIPIQETNLIVLDDQKLNVTRQKEDNGVCICSVLGEINNKTYFSIPINEYYYKDDDSKMNCPCAAKKIKEEMKVNESSYKLPKIVLKNEKSFSYDMKILLGEDTENEIQLLEFSGNEYYVPKPTYEISSEEEMPPFMEEEKTIEGIADFGSKNLLINSTKTPALWKWVWKKTNNITVGSPVEREKLIYWDETFNLTDKTFIIKGIYTGSAKEVEWNGNLTKPVNKTINITPIIINSSTLNLLPNYTYWDSSLEKKIPITKIEYRLTCLIKNCTKGIVIKNKEDIDWENVILETNINDSELKKDTISLSVLINNTQINITPEEICDSYSEFEINNSIWKTCYLDENLNAKKDYFKVIIPMLSKEKQISFLITADLEKPRIEEGSGVNWMLIIIVIFVVLIILGFLIKKIKGGEEEYYYFE